MECPRVEKRRHHPQRQDRSSCVQYVCVHYQAQVVSMTDKLLNVNDKRNPVPSKYGCHMHRSIFASQARTLLLRMHEALEECR